MEQSLSRRSFNGPHDSGFRIWLSIGGFAPTTNGVRSQHELLNSEVARRSDEQLRVHEGAALGARAAPSWHIVHRLLTGIK